MASLMSQNLIFKVTLLGNPSVGKTQLTRRFSGKIFDESQKATIGVDVTHTTRVVDGVSIRVNIFDTAGMERFRSVSSSYYRGSLGCFVVYDITDQKSYDSVSMWLETAREHADPDCVFMLVGNKCDRLSQRAVYAEDANQFAQAEEMGFIETSAKDSTNIDLAFERLLQEMFTVYKNRNRSAPEAPPPRGMGSNTNTYNNNSNSASGRGRGAVSGGRGTNNNNNNNTNNTTSGRAGYNSRNNNRQQQQQQPLPPPQPPPEKLDLAGTLGYVEKKNTYTRKMEAGCCS